MDEQKLTDWFPPEVLPARPGWYQREYSVRVLRAVPDYFDGARWFIGFLDGSYRSDPSQTPRRWCGLAEPPLTDWFYPDTPPEREGVYEIEAQDGEIRAFAHWTPRHGWGHTYYAIHWGDDWAIREAYRVRSRRGLIAPRRRWRGLAVQP